MSVGYVAEYTEVLTGATTTGWGGTRMIKNAPIAGPWIEAEKKKAQRNQLFLS